MTQEGRLARGKENYEKQRFLDNPETLEYISTLETEKPRPKKEVKEEIKEAE